MNVLYERCAGLDVHKDVAVGCVRILEGGRARYDVRRFSTKTAGLLELGDWLRGQGCTHVAMESTGCTGDRCGTCSRGNSSWCWPTPLTSATSPGVRAT